MEKTLITLDYPLQLADGTRTELEMRRPTLGDLIDYPINGDFDTKGESALMAVLCGLKPKELRAIDLNDYRKLQVQYLRFRNVSDSEGNSAGSDSAESLHALATE